MSEFIPYGRHVVEDDDIAAVTEVLKGEWLTTGPAVGRFEETFAAYVDAAKAVAVSSGTAALHLAMQALDIGPGAEVIVPSLTFSASANCVRYVGATVVFADVRDDTLTIDVDDVASLVTSRTKAIVCVDYGGLPCDLDELVSLCSRHGLALVEDACHAPGATYRGRRVGSIADISVFSLHPVKHFTSAEGGVVTTNDTRLADRVARLRNHGLTLDHRQREAEGTWRYDMVELGFNYRLSDLQCALGESQLRKAARGLARRRVLAARYRALLGGLADVRLPVEPSDREHAWHLYAIRVPAASRRQIYSELRSQGIGVNVHYVPVHLLSYYQALGYTDGLCPRAETAYEHLLSLPMWHGMTDAQQDRVAASLVQTLQQRV